MRPFAVTGITSMALWALGALAAEPSPPLTVAFGSNSIVVTGIEPGATIYLYSLAREPKGYYTSILPREKMLSDENRDGRVEWDLQAPLPWRSIWFVVDMASGKYVAAVPPQYHQARRIALTADHLKRDGAGEIVQFGFPGSVVECVVV